MHLPLVGTTTSFFLSVKKLVGNKIYLFLLTNVILSFLEGLGLALLIPLFFVLDSNKTKDSEWLKFIKKCFEVFHADFTVGRFFILVVTIFLIGRVFVLLSYLLDAKLFASAQNIIYQKALEAFSNMNFSYFAQNNSGFFNNLIQNEANRAIYSIQYYTKSINNLTMAIVMFLIALQNNFIFSVTILFFTATIFLILKKFFSETKSISYRLANENSKFQEMSFELFNNFKYLRGTNSMPQFLPLLQNSSFTVTNSKCRMKILSDRISPLTIMFLIPILAGLIYLFVVKFSYPVETILISIIVCQRALTKALSFQGMWQLFNNFLGSYKFFTKNISEISENSEELKGASLTGDSISLEIRDVEFSIQEKLILKIPELVIPKNKILSIVGASGSGKSTLVDLLTGIYIPQKGRVLVNEVDLKSINLKNYRNHIGLVCQDSYLFNDTIYNNISCWSQPSDEIFKRIKLAAQLANIGDFVESLPLKYETCIGDKGINLSGGQKQRIAIARELFKKPKLLLLDEATSGLDSESEYKIKETIESLRGKMTIVIVAHRLSTVQKSDMIVVMDSGSIVENGTYDELLLRDKSKFKDLVLRQLLKE